MVLTRDGSKMERDTGRPRWKWYDERYWEEKENDSITTS